MTLAIRKERLNDTCERKSDKITNKSEKKQELRNLPEKATQMESKAPCACDNE